MCKVQCACNSTGAQQQNCPHAPKQVSQTYLEEKSKAGGQNFNQTARYKHWSVAVVKFVFYTKVLKDYFLHHTIIHDINDGQYYRKKHQVVINWNYPLRKRRVCVCVFLSNHCSRLGARQLQIERLWSCCLCGQLKQGGCDSSRALWAICGTDWQMSPSFVIRTHVSQSWRLMPLLQHIYLSPRYLSLQCLALYYHGWQDQEPFPGHPPRRAIHEGLSWTIPAEFWWALLAAAAPSCPGSAAWERETSEMEMKMLPKDFIHIQTIMHLTKARKGRGGGRRRREEEREKGGEGATCCLNIHSLTWSRVMKSECRTKRWWCPCPDKGGRGWGAWCVSDEILLVCPALWTGCCQDKLL